MRHRLSLTPPLLLVAYRHGIFPMGEEESDEIFWFRPDPRAVLPLERFHISRSLARTLRRGLFEVTFDRAFREVMVGCAENRPVWISAPMHRAYNELHRLGHAHSVEVWRDGKLAGGLYGVQIGGAFMAESMFHRVTDASKVALVKLIERLKERRFALLDVQYLTEHIERFGGVEIPLRIYLRRLRKAVELECAFP
jgi:leucyl/phenylalanyl-tRNA--protein transferase